MFTSSFEILAWSFFIVFLQVFTFDFATTIHFINKMPRVKQSPRKNPRDIPNPTNRASILRNNHCKYFHLIYADAIRWLYSAVRWIHSVVRWYLVANFLRTCTLLYIINLFDFTVGCSGTVTCCCGTVVYCLGTVLCCGRMVNSML